MRIKVPVLSNDVTIVTHHNRRVPNGVLMGLISLNHNVSCLHTVTVCLCGCIDIMVIITMSISRVLVLVLVHSPQE